MQQTRFLASVVWWSVLTPVELVHPAQAVAKRFAEQTTGKTRHGLGSPHIQVWMAVLQAVVKETEKLMEENKPSPPTEQLPVVKSFLEEFKKAGPSAGHLFCSQARVKETKDGFGLLTYSRLANRDNVDRALHACLT